MTKDLNEFYNITSSLAYTKDFKTDPLEYGPDYNKCININTQYNVDKDLLDMCKKLVGILDRIVE